MKFIYVVFVMSILMGCKLGTNPTKEDNKELAALFEKYYDERMSLFPFEATTVGDNRYNDVLMIEFTNSYRAQVKDFYNRYLAFINHFEREYLNENDQLSYDIFKREMEMGLEGLTFQDNVIPFHQFWGTPLTLGQLGSGSGAQPFKTVEDYNNWEKRASKFSAWADSAIVYFKKGVDINFVLPKSLVLKMIPQMQNIVVTDVTKSLFYTPINNFPNSFSEQEKKTITNNYVALINNYLIPGYKKLGDFLQNEYLTKARSTSGISDLKDGDKLYKYLARFWTTTNKTPEEIYTTGLNEVKRIREEMEKVKTQVGFKGDLNAFFDFLKTDKQFMPYKNPQEVLDAFANIQKKIDPNLQKMFGKTPKTKFEIRQTEAFRAASASAEYNQGTADGSRPGIFYIPIIDATKFNTTSGMESLFLHEAIPGHHYQISLQQENNSLPKFRRYLWAGAYGEGWALYTESLGKELGLYTDPYQYMGALSDEIHRAIRLVVDVAIHTKNMTREEAIKYMMDNEPLSEEGVIAEIERYMAIPGQALSYKIGALKIRELRSKYEEQLTSKFNLSDFHDQFLKDGCMALEIVENKLNNWFQKKQ
jgi:uncharacterized protein (DUF885 family)